MRQTYDIKVQAPGFAVGEAKGIKLNVGDQQDLNFKLALAGTSQTVVATVEAPLIETTKTDVSTSVTDVDMRRLPTLNGAAGVANDYAQLALSAPGVKLDTSSLSRDPIGPGSINNRGNLYNVDGGNVTDQINSGRLGGIGASVDEIQEFQVLTNNYNAEYGQAGGLIINAVTKSGDNGIHGDGHMYFRLAASNFFYNLRLGTPSDGAPRAPFHRKEGGFTLGGPFKKDKLFWFASYELSRQSAPQTLTPPSGTITVQQPVNDLLYSGKLQYTPSDKHTFTVRYNVDRQFFDNQVSETGNNITPDDVTSIRIHSLGVNVGFVSTLTPTLVNEARFFFYRTINTKLDKTTRTLRPAPTSAVPCADRPNDINTWTTLPRLAARTALRPVSTSATILGSRSSSSSTSASTAISRLPQLRGHSPSASALAKSRPRTISMACMPKIPGRSLTNSP
jgi:hypothetical protein